MYSIRKRQKKIYVMEKIQTNNKNKPILQAHKTPKIKTTYLNKKAHPKRIFKTINSEN